MINAPATRGLRRWQLRGHYADLPLDQIGKKVALIVAAVLAIAAVFITAQSYLQSSTLREKTSTATSGNISLSAPRVPARAVERLERIDLSTVVSNPTRTRVENIWLELAVRDSSGMTVMSSRQGGIGLDPNDSRAIYWQWRIPGALPAGAYAVEVSASDAKGGRMAGEQPARAQLLVAK